MAPTNTVMDYMAQQNNLPSSSARAGARFSSQTLETLVREGAPTPPFSANGSETQPPSSSETHSDSSDDGGHQETNSAADILSRMSLEDLLRSPDRQQLVMLVPPSDPDEDPEGSWFHYTHRVAGQIREIMESKFDGLYYNWTHTPKKTRELWFKSFAQHFNWHLLHTETVEKEFKKQAGKQLRNLVCDWKRRKKQPIWMGDTLWRRFRKHWKSPNHLRISKKNSKARKTVKNGVGPPLHCTGQKSFIRRRVELRAILGRWPTDIELLVDTHKRKSDGVIIDPMTVQIVDKVNNKVTERLSQIASQDGDERELTPAEINDVFKSTAPSKRGRSYGLGSVSECRLTAVSVTPHPVITTLQTQLQETQEELRTAKEVMAQQKLDFEAQMAAMKQDNDAQLEARFKAFEDRFLARH